MQCSSCGLPVTGHVFYLADDGACAHCLPCAVDEGMTFEHRDEAVLVAEGIDLFAPEPPWFLDRSEAARHIRESEDPEGDEADRRYDVLADRLLSEGVL